MAEKKTHVHAWPRCSSRLPFATTESPAAFAASLLSRSVQLPPPFLPNRLAHRVTGKKIPFSVRPSSRKFKIRARHVQRGTDTTGSVSDALDWERGSASQAQRTPAPSQHGAVRVPIAIAVAACYDFMLARISWYGCTSEVRLRGLARICNTCPHSWRLSRPRMLDSQYASCCFSGL